MPWMCLERCGDNSTTIQQQLQQIKDHRPHFSGVSFEKYNLGANCTLIINNLTDVGKDLQKIGVETYPMISSYPYPPEFLDWMRQLFKTPDTFISTLIDQLNQNQYTGVNIDFEPTVDGTAQDAADYIVFLNKLADRLHQNSKRLTVDIANWNPVWDWSGLGKSKVDTVMLMSTYTGTDSTFRTMFERGVREIGVAKLGVGLESDLKNPLTKDQLTFRFNLIQSANIQEIDIWRMGIPDIWWPFIEKFNP